MKLKIIEERFGEVEMLEELTPDLTSYHIEDTRQVVLKGVGFKALMQEFKGDWFSAWYSRYWISSPTVLKAIGDIPFLELRIAWRNMISGSWENIEDPALKMHYFTISFATHINTKAFFDRNELYETFDIHIDVRRLYEFGVDYKILRDFIEKVLNNEPGNIGEHPYSCPKNMIDAVFSILNNTYTGYQKKVFLDCKIKELLVAALVTIGTPEKILPTVLNASDKEKLEEVKMQILLALPKYPGNENLCRMTGLNETKLIVGFQHFFGQPPSDYYREQRLLMGKNLLLKGDMTIEAISSELNYAWSSGFIRAFKELYGYTPLQFAKNNGIKLPNR